VERAGRHEEHVVRPDRSVARRHGGALDDGEHVPLHALAGDVGSGPLAGAEGDLVDLVDEDDPAVLHAISGLAVDPILIEARLGLLVGEQVEGLPHLELAAPGLGRVHPLHEALEIDAHLLEALAPEGGGGTAPVDELHLDLAVVEIAGPEPLPDAVAGGDPRRLRLLAESLADLVRAVARRGRLRSAARQQGVQQPLLGRLARLPLDLGPQLLPHEGDPDLDEVADHRLHVAPDVADLRVLAGLDLHERRTDDLAEPAGDLGLADAGRADHEDVLRENVPGHLGLELLAAPAVPDGDGDGPLGLVLAHDVPVEGLHDLVGGEVLHETVSTSMRSFV
jgi:hypothetical protein